MMPADATVLSADNSKKLQKSGLINNPFFICLISAKTF